MEGTLRQPAPRLEIIRNLGRDPGAALGFAIVAGTILLAVLAPLLPLRDPTDLDLQNPLLAPSYQFPLGSDHLGRDELSRLIFGARTTLMMSGVSLLIIMGIASIVGALAGYYGGWIDTGLMMVVDLLLAFPSLILGVAVAGILGPSLINVMIAVSVVWWASHARVIRGMFLSARRRGVRRGGPVHWRRRRKNNGYTHRTQHHGAFRGACDLGYGVDHHWHRRIELPGSGRATADS